jgi:hypothetical protein
VETRSPILSSEDLIESRIDLSHFVRMHRRVMAGPDPAMTA